MVADKCKKKRIYKIWYLLFDIPNFDTKLSQNVIAIHGRTTKLVCRFFNLGNKTVRIYWLQINAKGKRI